MAQVVLILGKSGTGKSTSVRNLAPEETLIINVLKKELPFKGSRKLYNKENKNLFNVDDPKTIVSYLEAIDKKRPQVKNVIIDDITYIMRNEYFKTAKITGFNKFIDIASNFKNIIEAAKDMRDDLTIFLMMHCEEVMSDNVIVTYKASTIGKMVDNSYNPLEVVSTVLFSSVKYDSNQKPIYGFYTNKCMEGNTEIPAKSPEGLFEEIFIPNDLKIVTEALNEYYN